MARRWMVVMLVWVAFAGLLGAACAAASTEEIEEAVNAGISWLVGQQTATGEWEYSGEISPTGFAVLKLEDYAFEHDTTPFDPAYDYVDNVLLGFDHLFRLAHLDDTDPLAPLVWFANSAGDHETYSTGIVMMAIAASQDPTRVVTTAGSLVNGWTYQDVVQACVNWFAATQNPDGGWRYFGILNSDNSNTGYATLGLRYAELFGCTVPASPKANLDGFVDYIQCDANGGSGYEVPCDWVNVLKTGNLLFEMAFLGDALTSVRAQDALAYIEAHWNDSGAGINDPGWRPQNYQAMYCLMKGFGAMGIQTIEVLGIETNWYQEFADAIIASQAADGSWSGDPWGGQLLSTEWALLVLEYVVPPYEVLIDIKPWSFPNSINPGQNGTTTVAILSTEDFDAPALVDPSSLTFGPTGDEASLSYRGKKDPKPQVGYEDANGDGLVDVVAHFVTDLCGFDVGDIAGYLKGTTYDGLGILGDDSVRITPSVASKSEAPGVASSAGDLVIQVGPNPVQDVHTAHFRVTGPMSAEVAEIRVEIFDLAGQLVWEETTSGNEIDWHTDALSGEYLANGVYIYRVLVLVGGDWISRIDKLVVFR